MLAHTSARTCSGGNRVRACERARAVAVIACEYAQVVQQLPSRASVVSHKVVCMQR
jgi:hypothetical protein